MHFTHVNVNTIAPSPRAATKCLPIVALAAPRAHAGLAMLHAHSAHPLGALVRIPCDYLVAALKGGSEVQSDAVPHRSRILGCSTGTRHPAASNVHAVVRVVDQRLGQVLLELCLREHRGRRAAFGLAGFSPGPPRGPTAFGVALYHRAALPFGVGPSLTGPPSSRHLSLPCVSGGAGRFR